MNSKAFCNTFYLCFVFFTYNVNAVVGSEFNPNETWTRETFVGNKKTLLADVTGDGKADAIAVNDNNILIRSSDGMKFMAESSWTDSPFFGDRDTFFADVNGDRYADVIAVNSSNIQVRLSHGDQFLTPKNWTLEPYHGSKNTSFADVTGDGKADAIVVNGDMITVRSSDGSKFTDYKNWTNEAFFGSRGTFFADVTGDKKADAIAVNDNKVTVRPSDGTKFSGNEDWTQEPYFGDKESFFTDVTGDGKADAIVVNNNNVTVRRSDGSKFTNNEYWTQGPYYGSRGTLFADVTGDNRADAIAINEDKLTIRRARADLTVLTANAGGTGTTVEPNVTWKVRVDRLAHQISTIAIPPDIISITEHFGWHWCAIGTPENAGDYDFVDRLIWRLQSLLGITYRIAYMVGKISPVGDINPCNVFVGDVVLYNPSSLINKSSENIQQYQQHPHDEIYIGKHLRRSLPLCNRGTHLMPLDQLIDGSPQTDKCGRATPSAPAWVILTEGIDKPDNTKNDGKPYKIISASMARFAYAYDPNVSFDFYTVHPYPDLVLQDSQTQLITDFFTALSTPPYRTEARYYPPLVVGDFNSLAGTEPGSQDPEWPQGVDSVFVYIGDVIAVKLGQNSRFPAQHELVPTQKIKLPLLGECSPFEFQAFSDHCALLVSFTKDGVPTPPPAEPLPPIPPPISHDQCIADCKAERDDCIERSREPGGPRPQQCILLFNRCTANCPL